MEIMDGFNQYDNIYNKAYWAKNELDRPKRYFDVDFAKDSYSEFLLERQKNRVQGDIAFAEALRKKPIRYKQDYTDNFKSLVNEINDSALIFEAENFNLKNYPKTSKIRNILVENNRFRLDEVLPKLTGLKKLAMKLKTMR